MCDLKPSACGCALDVLDYCREEERGRDGWGRPDGFLDRGLLAHPDAFGRELVQTLREARDCVLRKGDAWSQELLLEASARKVDREITRIRCVLAGRPKREERQTPALVRVRGELTIALAYPIPCGGRRLSVRVQIDLHPDVVYTSATRVEPDPELLARWSALGHTAPPHSTWICEPPSWCLGHHGLAIELLPNPSGFAEAMLIAHQGAGRVLVPTHDPHATCVESEWRSARVLPSGWSYLSADRTMGSSLPVLPNGAPHPVTHVRVPDDEIFARCAARTWAASLRDSIWLRRRGESAALSGTQSHTHAPDPEATQETTQETTHEQNQEDHQGENP